MSTQTLPHEELLERIRRSAPYHALGEARRALEVTLRALGESLPEPQRDALALALPAFAEQLRAGKPAAQPEIEAFYRRVRRHEGSQSGFAREHAQSVCRVLGEQMTGDALRSLDDVLPASFVALFRHDVQEGEPPPYGDARTAGHRTLASGRPGSRHPMSESRPPAAQSHSVVREANPHADTKLSSAEGSTQERLDESLAKAGPEPRRRISEAKD